MKKTILTLALATLPATSMATMSYSYIEAGVEAGEVEIAGTDFDTIALEAAASFAVHKNVAVMVGAYTDEVDLPAPFELTSYGYSFGVIGHAPISERVDFLLGAGVGYIEMELSDGFLTLTEDDTAKALTAGIRGLVTPGLEAEFRANVVDAFEETEESYAVAARAHFNPFFSGSVTYSWADGYGGLGVGIRLNY